MIEKPSAALEAAFRGIKGVHRVWFNPTTKRLSLWYSSDDVDIIELYTVVKDVGFQTGTATLRLRIRGIYCAGCISLIENVLREVPGVAAAVLNPATEEAAVEYDPQSTDLGRLEKAVDSLGMYRAEPGGRLVVTNKRVIFSGPRKNVSFPVSKILEVHEYTDGLSINREGKQKTEYYLGKFELPELKYHSVWELVNAVINAVFHSSQ